MALIFSMMGCSTSDKSLEIEETSKQYEAEIEEYREEIAELQSTNEGLSTKLNDYEKKILELEQELTKLRDDAARQSAVFDSSEIPEYMGEASVAINDNIPFFTEGDLKITGEKYSDLDDKGRCGVCVALVGPETLPTEARGSIGDIKPSGWETVRYEGIDGNYLYNRCHLIGWQLTGENANPKNLITGTRYMNTQGMEPIEIKVANYVEATGNHVLYRSTPIFDGDNLLATGVLLEALSLEDDSIKINSFCYNVQPNVTIDYATGKSEGPVFLGADSEQTLDSDITRQKVMSDNEVQAEEPKSAEEESTEITYVGNSNSHKFHKPDCSSVSDMKDRNKVYFYGDRQEVIEAGYQPCQKCNP